MLKSATMNEHRAPSTRTTFALLVAASAALAILGALIDGNGRWLHYVCKPLTTLLLLWMALAAGPAASTGYRRSIAVGLVLSVAGDIFLMLPGDWFVPGLVSFLLAHIAYATAFARGASTGATAVALLAYALVSGLILAGLLPSVPTALQLPVLAYVAVIAVMAALAAARAWRLRSTAVKTAHPARIAALGGALFILSDTLLAWDRFVTDIPVAIVWVLASYYAAQWCIADSVRGTSAICGSPAADPCAPTAAGS